MGFYENNRKNIEKLIQLGVFDNKRIALWQIDGYSRDSISVFTSYGIKPDAILSFDERLYGKKIWGIPVFEPFFWLMSNRNDVVILMSKFEYSFHKNHLINVVGISPKNIYINLRRKPVYSTYHLKKIIEKVKQKCRNTIKRIIRWFSLITSWIIGVTKLMRGCNVYKRIRLKCGRDTNLLFVNFAGLGDAYILAILFEAYKDKARLSNYVFLTYSQSSAKVISMILPSAKVNNITLKEKDYFERFISVMDLKELKVKKMVCLPEYKNIYMKIAGERFTLFDTFSRYIYGLDDSQIKTSIPVFSSDNVFSQRLFEEKHIRKGKTIILAPNANSEPPIDLGVWADIARLLINQGFDVVSMCHGNEIPIKYTESIDFPLEKAWEVVDYAGYYVGIRCGFTDLISETECKKIIIYPQSPYVPPEYWLCKHMNGATIYEYASFSRMGIGRNILDIPVEYKYCNRLEKMILMHING